MLRVTFLYELQSQALLSPAKLHISVTLSPSYGLKIFMHPTAILHYPEVVNVIVEVKNVHYAIALDG